MQRRQLLGIVLFGIGGSLLASNSIYFSFFFNQFYIGPGPGPTPTEVLLIDSAFGFVPYFLIGLGLYLIFKPLLAMGILLSGPETRKSKLLEKENKAEIERIKQLSDEELQKELVSMKTIEHVLVPRLGVKPNENSPESAELAQMLKKTRDRISAVEVELKERRKVKEQEQLTPFRS